MSRKIDIKIYDKIRNHYIIPWEGKIYEDIDLVFADDEWYIQGGHALNDRYIIQQYIGLKDKDGKKIFEGNILKFERWQCPQPNPNIEDYAIFGLKRVVYGTDHGDIGSAGFVAINLNPADLEDGMILNTYNTQFCMVMSNI